LTRVKKTQIFNKNPRTPDKTEKKTDLVKKTSSGNAIQGSAAGVWGWKLLQTAPPGSATASTCVYFDSSA